jgi:hypothetical protein
VIFDSLVYNTAVNTGMNMRDIYEALGYGNRKLTTTWNFWNEFQRYAAEDIDNAGELAVQYAFK